MPRHRPAPTSKREGPPPGLKTAARDHCWLFDFRHGSSHAEIAGRSRVKVAAVVAGIARAKVAERAYRRAVRTDGCSRLVPMFPIGPLTPDSVCPHRGPLPRGSRLYCVVCDRSGIDSAD